MSAGPDRGRVPFALVGVLLLVTSATYAGGLDRQPVREPRVSEAVEGHAATVTATLRETGRTAAFRAAADPVVEPANTTAGRALDPESPFLDALRLRVYLRTRRALGDLDRRTAGVAVSASLPAVDSGSTADLRRAVERVDAEPAGPDGSKLRLTVRGVDVTASRHGREVASETVDPTVVVDVPALAVHDRVATFERRLDAGPLDPGLGRQLTGALYPIVWARGYAQYAGAPIDNVLANRHVALATNGAVLALQRAVFGASDPVGGTALRRATARTGVTDILRGTDSRTLESLNRSWRNAPDPSPLPDRERLSQRARDLGPSPEALTTVSVGTTADDAYLGVVDGLDETVTEAYTARVRRTVRTEHLGRRWVRRPSPPADATLVEERSSVSTAVEGRFGGTPSVDGPWHRLDHAAREVHRTTTRVRVWRTPSGRETTRSRRVDRVAVDVVLAGRHDGGTAPSRPVAPVHSPGGALDGPNLAGVAAEARGRLLRDAGGVDRLAAAAARGELNRTERTAIVGERPPELRAWLRADLQALRREVANVSVRLERGAVASFGASPATRLGDRLAERRSDLLDAPRRYDGVADRARVAARAAYLDRVADRLHHRAQRREARRAAVGERLPRGTELLETAYDRRAGPPDEGSGSLNLSVDGRPSYLTVGAVGREAVPSLASGETGHPLGVRNVNTVSPPYAEAVGPVVDAFFGPERVDLRTAAQVLVAARRTERRHGRAAGSAVGSRELVREDVAGGVDHLEGRLVGAFAEAGVGTPDARRAVVERGLSRWDTPGSRALALANGSGTAAVHESARDEWSLSRVARTELRLRLDRAVRRGLDTQRVRVRGRATNLTAISVRETVRSEAKRRAESRVAELTGETAERVGDRLPRGLLSSLPAGVPVAPVPGFWYLTANVWRVQVRGVYGTFVVRAPRGDPATGRFRYVRDGDPVGLDLDGDGHRERLGTASRVGFETGTVVAVGVPPGPRGVGDVDGTRSEESAGWPDPGWK